MESNFNRESPCEGCPHKSRNGRKCEFYEKDLIEGVDGIYRPCPECETDRLLEQALYEYAEKETDDFIKKYGDIEPEEPLMPFDEYLKIIEAKMKE
ncbi:MAG: hypothetical protein ACI4FO_09445 [Acutalibacteraceae bacterium]